MRERELEPLHSLSPPEEPMLLATILIRRTKFLYIYTYKNGKHLELVSLRETKTLRVRQQTEENNVSESEKNATIRETYFSCFP